MCERGQWVEIDEKKREVALLGVAGNEESVSFGAGTLTAAEVVLMIMRYCDASSKKDSSDPAFSVSLLSFRLPGTSCER